MAAANIAAVSAVALVFFHVKRILSFKF